MIRIEGESFKEDVPDPETLFKKLHKNNADIIDRTCNSFSGKEYESFEKEIQRLNTILIATYGGDTGAFEGEFDKEVLGIGVLHVKFYSMGYMELSVHKS